MGNYNKEERKFNLIVSVRYDGDADLPQWEKSFEAASQLLYAATDGQQQLGKVHVCTKSTGQKNADIFLDPAEPWPHSKARIWHEGMHAVLTPAERFSPFIIVHELGHYLYDLGDENDGPQPWPDPLKTPTCIGYEGDNPVKPSACIMERSADLGDSFVPDANDNLVLVEGPTTDFCVKSNHDLGQMPEAPAELLLNDLYANDTYQSHRHGDDCWTVIQATYPDLESPGDMPDAERPAAEPIQWHVLLPEQRFVLALDHSGSMGINDAEPLKQALLGTEIWGKKLIEPDGQAVPRSLGIVAFDDHTQIHPLTSMSNEADSDAVAIFTSAVELGGSTAMGDALRDSLAMIKGAGAQASTQVIVLLSDGKHNTGEDPIQVLPELIEFGVRVHTIGVGPWADLERLSALAEGTGGKFYRVASALDAEAGEQSIDDVLTLLSAEALDNEGVVTVGASVLGGWDPSAEDGDGGDA